MPPKPKSPISPSKISLLIGIVVVVGVGLLVWGNWDALQVKYHTFIGKPTHRMVLDSCGKAYVGNLIRHDATTVVFQQRLGSDGMLVKIEVPKKKVRKLERAHFEN